ncbi:MAG: polysaccharide biosynthesis protein [Clostridia bacterium]|nr:polysaccharide biosynthesis protein [Clostridia bacterium]
MSANSKNSKSLKVKNSKNVFFSGVLVLTLSNIIVKVLGAFLKVPLTSESLLGNQGIGYYQAAYEIYVWFYTISTVGLPVAVSIMISGSRAKGRFTDTKKMFKVIFGVFLTIGAVGTALMIVLRKFFAGSYEQPIEWCILVIAPTLLLVCVSSAFRGYFQGHQSMTPTAISEVIEAVGKFSLGILFALYAKKQGYPLHIVAAYALVGLTIGTALGMLYLFVTKLVFREEAYNADIDAPEDDGTVTPSGTIVKTLFMIGIPITISSSVMSLTNVIDGMILSSRLQGMGYTAELAASLFGNYKALAVTMFNLPPALIYPISASIVPLLSRAVSGGNKKLVGETMNSSLKISAIISLPCALGMAALSKPLLGILFKDSFAVDAASPLLSVLAPSIFFLSMLSITNSFLQAHGYQHLPIISMIAGAVVKLLSTYFLLGVFGSSGSVPTGILKLSECLPEHRAAMYAAPIGTFLCYFVTMILNFFFVAKKIGFRPNVFRLFVKPFVSSLVCSASAVGSFYLIPSSISSTVRAIIAVAVAGVVYLVMIAVLKTLDREDILLLPKGEKIYSALHRFRFV